MNVISTPLRASLRVTNMQDEVVQTFHRMRHDIPALDAEAMMTAVSMVRGIPIGNGFLTVTSQLTEAA